MESKDKKKPGCVWPVLWVVASTLGTLVCAAVVGIMAADSERAGTNATMIVALPVGFLWAGSLAAIITAFIKSENKGLRYGMPFGCGCLGGLTLLFMIFFFFVAIFPSL